MHLSCLVDAVSSEGTPLLTPADHEERLHRGPGARCRRPRLGRLGRAQTETRLQPGDLYPSVGVQSSNHLPLSTRR